MNLWRKTLPPPVSEVPLPQRASSSLHEAPRASSPSWVSIPPPQSRPLLHATLFVLTLLSMTAAGAMQQGVNLRWARELWGEVYRRVDEAKSMLALPKHRPFRKMPHLVR